MAFPTTKSFLVRGRAYVKTTDGDGTNSMLYCTLYRDHRVVRQKRAIFVVVHLFVVEDDAVTEAVCVLGKLATLVNFVAHYRWSMAYLFFYCYRVLLEQIGVPYRLSDWHPTCRCWNSILHHPASHYYLARGGDHGFGK
jgi:hypothetical protein